MMRCDAFYAEKVEAAKKNTENDPENVINLELVPQSPFGGGG